MVEGSRAWVGHQPTGGGESRTPQRRAKGGDPGLPHRHRSRCTGGPTGADILDRGPTQVSAPGLREAGAEPRELEVSRPQRAEPRCPTLTAPQVPPTSCLPNPAQSSLGDSSNLGSETRAGSGRESQGVPAGAQSSPRRQPAGTRRPSPCSHRERSPTVTSSTATWNPGFPEWSLGRWFVP